MDVESMRQDQVLRDVLKVVVDEGRLEHKTSQGIAKQVLAGCNYDDLSAGQQDVFDDFIVPHLRPKCESCGEQIDIDEVEGAYLLNGVDYDGVYCEECRLRIIRNDKD